MSAPGLGVLPPGQGWYRAHGIRALLPTQEKGEFGVGSGKEEGGDKVVFPPMSAVRQALRGLNNNEK